MTDLLLRNPVAQPSVFWRKTVHDRIGYFDESLHYAGDFDMWVRMHRHCNVGSVMTTLSVFALRSDSISGTAMQEVIRERGVVQRRYGPGLARYGRVMRPFLSGFALVRASAAAVRNTVAGSLARRRFWASLRPPRE